MLLTLKTASAAFSASGLINHPQTNPAFSVSARKLGNFIEYYEKLDFYKSSFSFLSTKAIVKKEKMCYTTCSEMKLNILTK